MIQGVILLFQMILMLLFSAQTTLSHGTEHFNLIIVIPALCTKLRYHRFNVLIFISAKGKNVTVSFHLQKKN